MAARTLGYNVHVLDPDAKCAASAVADRVVAARFDDADAAAELARHCDVVTLEIEQIGVAALEAVRAHAPLRPGVEMIKVIQDRALQKQWLVGNGLPVGAYHDVASAEDLEDAARELGPLFVKSCRGGYDGRSQARVSTPGDAHDAWRSLGERPAVAEQALDLELELSVLVARRPSGEVRVYPPALNMHERQILAWSVIPATPCRCRCECRASRALDRGALSARGNSRGRDVPVEGRTSTRERACPAPAQFISRDGGRVLHEPVRAARARGM